MIDKLWKLAMIIYGAIFLWHVCMAPPKPVSQIGRYHLSDDNTNIKIFDSAEGVIHILSVPTEGNSTSAIFKATDHGVELVTA